MRPILLILLIAMATPMAFYTKEKESKSIRTPVFAGRFYSSDSQKLRLGIEKFLQDAEPSFHRRPAALIVPHAGYIFSGQICADAYRQAAGETYDLVVLLGTNHSTADLNKIAVFPGKGYQTPLGTTFVEEGVRSRLLENSPDCRLDEAAHREEHSLEVQIPFLQHLFPKTPILPIIVCSGDSAMYRRFGGALAKTIRDRKALLIASSDLSHYPDAEHATPIDISTLETISGFKADLFQRLLQDTRMSVPGLSTRACGEAPILALLAALKSLGVLYGQVVSYSNSGDTLMGEAERVVGYGAVLFSSQPIPLEKKTNQRPADRPPSSAPLIKDDQIALLSFARETLQRYFTTDTVPLPRHFRPAVFQRQGAFVTLKKNGMLRGCIGHMAPDIPLCRNIGKLALHAALQDTRFAPVQPQELADLHIEISVLTPMRPVNSYQKIQVGKDGVFLRKGSSSAVFLPQVATEQGWSREELLEHLCEKAGLPQGCWQEKAQLFSFQSEVFQEEKRN